MLIYCAIPNTYYPNRPFSCSVLVGGINHCAAVLDSRNSTTSDSA